LSKASHFWITLESDSWRHMLAIRPTNSHTIIDCLMGLPCSSRYYTMWCPNWSSDIPLANPDDLCCRCVLDFQALSEGQHFARTWGTRTCYIQIFRAYVFWCIDLTKWN
jgi:hypothetical protein